MLPLDQPPPQASPRFVPLTLHGTMCFICTLCLLQALLAGEADMVAFLGAIKSKAVPGKLHNPSAWVVSEAKLWAKSRREEPHAK